MVETAGVGFLPLLMTPDSWAVRSSNPTHMVTDVNTSQMLDCSWPTDLDPATVPFKARTVTVLRRRGLFDEWVRFNDLSEAAVLSWWNTGPITVDDLRSTGNEAIRRHHNEADLLQSLKADLETIPAEPWARHIWRQDPRFAEFLPKCDATVYDVAMSGSALDRRYLWEHLDSLRSPPVTATGQIIVQ